MKKLMNEIIDDIMQSAYEAHIHNEVEEKGLLYAADIVKNIIKKFEKMDYKEGKVQDPENDAEVKRRIEYIN